MGWEMCIRDRREADEKDMWPSPLHEKVLGTFGGTSRYPLMFLVEEHRQYSEEIGVEGGQSSSQRREVESSSEQPRQ